MNRLRIQFLFVAVIFTAFTSCKKDMLTDDSISGKTSLLTENAVSTLATVAETKIHTYKPITYSISSNCGGYWEGLPGSYSSTTQKYPLLIFLTGESKLGDGSQTQLTKISGPVHSMLTKGTFPPNFVSGGNNYSFIVITPQFKQWPSSGYVNGVINYASSKYRVDKSRIYVVGLSMGGGVTWDYAGSKYAYKVAAIAPVCGATGPSDAKAQMIASEKIPVWAFHNQYDDKVSYYNTINWVNAINKFSPNPKPKMTIFQDPDKGHDAWSKAFSTTYKENNMNVYEWLLQYHL